jgi:hypothetical protein
MIDENIQNEVSTPSKEGSVGALIGSIIIVLILILGGWYIWQEAKKISNLPPIEKEITINEVNSIDSLLSDDLDLEFERGLDSIDQEFE